MTTQPLGTAAANAEPSAPWIPDDSTFGARLGMIRQRMGWGNVKEAALACGVPVQSWRNWERDHGNPRNYIAIAQRIADRSGCDYLWLVAGKRGTRYTYTPPAVRPPSVRPKDTRPPGGPSHSRPVPEPAGNPPPARRPARTIAPTLRSDLLRVA